MKTFRPSHHSKTEQSSECQSALGFREAATEKRPSRVCARIEGRIQGKEYECGSKGAIKYRSFFFSWLTRLSKKMGVSGSFSATPWPFYIRPVKRNGKLLQRSIRRPAHTYSHFSRMISNSTTMCAGEVSTLIHAQSVVTYNNYKTGTVSASTCIELSSSKQIDYVSLTF